MLAAATSTVDKLPLIRTPEEVAIFLAPYNERATQRWSPSYSVFIPAFDSFSKGQLVTSSVSINVFDSIYPSEPADKIAQSIQDILWDPKMAVFDKSDSKNPLPGPPALLYHVSFGKHPSYENATSWLGTYGRLYLLKTYTDYNPAKDRDGQPLTLAPDKSGNPNSSIWVAEYKTRSRLLVKQEILKSWPVNDSLSSRSGGADLYLCRY